MIHRYANPTRFIKLTGAMLPYLSALCAVLFAYGFYLAWFDSPPDYQQGQTVRIMYMHVPSAWMAMFIYSVIAFSSLLFLVFRHGVADMIARASGWIGAVFALLTLVTGSIWGKPMWGAWWVWDARLTSMLVLFFIYVGYSVMARQADHNEGAQKICAVIALVGMVNIPIIKFSVEWWATLHQPASVFRLDGPTLDGSMLLPLLVMAGAFTCFYLVVVIYGVRTIITRAKLHRLRLQGMS